MADHAPDIRGLSPTLPHAREAVELLDSIRCIREGLEQARRGEGTASDEFFTAFRKQRGLAKPGA
jgi:hypothetical protein